MLQNLWIIRWLAKINYKKMNKHSVYLTSLNLYLFSWHSIMSTFSDSQKHASLEDWALYDSTSIKYPEASVILLFQDIGVSISEDKCFQENAGSKDWTSLALKQVQPGSF